MDLRASNGNVTNLFSNDEDESNGLVKAWAQIDADGTIVACRRCNKDPNETRRTGTGTYEVDFTPLTTFIQGRPRSATIDHTATGEAAMIKLTDRGVDQSSVFVRTLDEDGAAADLPFVLIVY